MAWNLALITESFWRQSTGTDGILIVGDMIVRNDPASLKTASSLLSSLAQQYPVYYALGNHEYKLYRTDPQENCMAARYQEYEKALN